MKNKNIQYLRAVAILAVLIIHTTSGAPGEIYIRPLVNFSVALFLFLSGYLTPVNDSGTLKLFAKRLTRVIIPYLIWSVLYMSYRHAWITFGESLGKILTGRSCGIYYYIFVYIQITILIPLLIKLARSRVWWIGLLITPVAILGETMYAFKAGYLLFPWNINNCFVWITYFYMGLLGGNVEELQDVSWGRCYREISAKLEFIKDIRHKKGWNLAKIPFVLFPLLIGYLLEVREGIYWQLIGRVDLATTQVKLSAMVNSVIILIIIFQWLHLKQNEECYHMPRNIFSVILLEIGNCSFGIYLCHPLILRILENHLKHTDLMKFPFNTLLVFIISFALVEMIRHICGIKIGKLLGVY